MFHTCSVAEYIDNQLRILLFQYASCIDGNTKDGGALVLNDNMYFQSAVHKYKHITTNFLTSKLKCIHNDVSIIIIKEFKFS